MISAPVPAYENEATTIPEPPAASAETSGDLEEAPLAANGNGDSGQPRRRRRRGRRGRGRGGASAEGVQDGEVALPPAVGMVAAVDDEPMVPRGVVAHELMPAATGGRSRRRGHRGGRARRAGLSGERVDPQLISPLNPVPRPGFDEE